ncbi:hypothetical protein LR48_Vigan02g122500 [Vigna angularis]|uniref:Uncharacterized protein n=1 Tax=Phaseolus angularis TaxID=3914 RepID=A0A0L9TX11_PHAAN|nr:hypothetical protein LR48_Vigan02g122500 [Vigna angularis]
MLIVELSSSEESIWRGGRGYADGGSESSLSSVGSSILGSTERCEASVDRGTTVHINNNVALVKGCDDCHGIKCRWGVDRMLSVLSSPFAKRTKRACHRKEGYTSDFFYTYSTIYRDMSVQLLFSEFQMGVLRELKVTPIQLRPNGWAFM